MRYQVQGKYFTANEYESLAWWSSWCSILCKRAKGGWTMSGDVSLKDEPVIFYSEYMTTSKEILLKHKGIKFNLYRTVLEKIGKLK